MTRAPVRLTFSSCVDCGEPRSLNAAGRCMECGIKKYFPARGIPRPGSPRPPLPPAEWRTNGRIAVACLGLAVLFAASAVVETAKSAVVAFYRWRDG